MPRVKQPAANGPARHRIVMVRLNADEHRAVSRAAKKEQRPVSTYLRERALVAATEKAA